MYNVCLHKKNVPKLAIFHDFQSHVRFLANRNVKISTTFQETVYVPAAAKEKAPWQHRLSKVCNNSIAINYKPKKGSFKVKYKYVSQCGFRDCFESRCMNTYYFFFQIEAVSFQEYL